MEKEVCFFFFLYNFACHKNNVLSRFVYYFSNAQRTVVYIVINETANYTETMLPFFKGRKCVSFRSTLFMIIST